MMRDFPLHEEVTEALDDMMVSIRHLDRTVRDMLDLSRSGGGRAGGVGRAVRSGGDGERGRGVAPDVRAVDKRPDRCRLRGGDE